MHKKTISTKRNASLSLTLTLSQKVGPLFEKVAPPPRKTFEWRRPPARTREEEAAAAEAEMEMGRSIGGHVNCRGLNKDSAAISPLSLGLHTHTLGRRLIYGRRRNRSLWTRGQTFARSWPLPRLYTHTHTLLDAPPFEGRKWQWKWERVLLMQK